MYKLSSRVRISPRDQKNSIVGTSLDVQWLRLCFHCRGCRFDLQLGTKTLNDPWPKKQTNEQTVCMVIITQFCKYTKNH